MVIKHLVKKQNFSRALFLSDPQYRCIYSAWHQRNNPVNIDHTFHSSISQASTNGMVRQLLRSVAWSVIALQTLSSAPAYAREISSYAFINEDGTLRIKRKTIHLYGIHIPGTGNQCTTNLRPQVCGSRAALALEFKIQGFVRCEIIEENTDGSLDGWCRVNASRLSEGEDLSAYLLERGWAVALPDAPVEYQALEKIAYRRGFGIWGFPIDSVIRSGHGHRTD